jgi:hypothetical protein
MVLDRIASAVEGLASYRGRGSSRYGGALATGATRNDTRELIRTVALANAGWRAPRIHGELQKLGIDISERTVSRILRTLKRPPSQSWKTFLQSPERDRGHRLLHSSHDPVASAIRLPGSGASTQTSTTFRRHRTSHRRMGQPARDRSLCGTRRQALSPRPRLHLRPRVSWSCPIARDERSGLGASESPAERIGRKAAITCGPFVTLLKMPNLRVWIELDHTEGSCCPGKSVAVLSGADEHIDRRDKIFRLPCSLSGNCRPGE